MSSAAKVGAFMLVILAILGFFILKIEDVRIGRGAQTKKVDVIFDSVAGLDNKSAVRVAGVRVGKVSAIKLTPDGKARVTLEIDKDVELHRDARATVANLGLLGEKYIEIEPGRPNLPLIGDDQQVTLPGSQPATIDEVTNQVSAIATDVKAITASLRTALGGPAGERRVDEIVENVRGITERMRLILDANQGNVNITAANLRQITADLRVEIPRIAGSIDKLLVSMNGTVGENREDVHAVVENLRTLSASLKTTATNLNDITGQVRSGEGTVGKLFYSDEAHTKLTSALTAVESGVNELKETLGRVNKLQLDVGIKSDYYAGLSDTSPLPLNSHSRSGVMANLIPNPETNRFYRLELNDDPKGNRREKVTQETVTDTQGNSSTIVRSELRYDRQPLYSVQAGWKLNSYDLRVGLFDSTGGVGADYHLNNRLSVSGEAFDFGKSRDDQPHLRFYGQYTFRRQKPNFPALFVSTGVDDPLNDTAFTFGGGIRWTDNDLKYLLGSIPIPK